jgi:hypothetical protein
MKGTWTTKPAPKVLETVLGVVAIVLIVLLGLYSQAAGRNTGNGRSAVYATTPAPASPSPRR